VTAIETSFCSALTHAAGHHSHMVGKTEDLNRSKWNVSDFRCQISDAVVSRQELLIADVEL